MYNMEPNKKLLSVEDENLDIKEVHKLYKKYISKSQGAD